VESGKRNGKKDEVMVLARLAWHTAWTFLPARLDVLKDRLIAWKPPGKLEVRSANRTQSDTL
jgi:hypothetical protein